MKKVIVQGKKPAKVFECTNCHCQFESDEYTELNVRGDMITYYEKCPQCKVKITVTE